MFFYVVAAAYFYFILEGMLRKHRKLILTIMYPLTMYPIASSLYLDQKFLTFTALILTVLLPIISFKLFKLRRFTFFALTITICAFYIADYSITEHFQIISLGLILFAAILMTNDKSLWILLLLGFSLTLLPKTFTPSKEIFLSSFDYHIIFVPQLIYIIGILFFALLIPFSLGVLRDKASPLSFFITAIFPLFAILHLNIFFNTLNTENNLHLMINKMLMYKFQIILLLFTFLQFMLVLRNTSLFKHLTGLVCIQTSYVLLLTYLNNSTQLIFELSMVLALSALISYMIIIDVKSKTTLLKLIFLCLCLVFTPIRILFYLNQLTIITIFQIIFFIVLIYFSTRLLSFKVQRHESSA